MKRFRSYIFYAIGILGLIAMAFACPATRFIMKLDSPREQLEFSAEGWNSSMYLPDGTFSGTRLEMVEDLLNRYDFHHWTLSQVEQLLGKPVERQTVAEPGLVQYDLRDGLNLLIFEVDSQKKVVNYYVRSED
jgi:hypothetical protein